jgi:hypothetical protein
MGGIVFFRTADRDAVVEFYTERVGASVWLEQPNCTILTFDGFRFGFLERGDPETEGTLTFVVPHRGGVDRLHDDLADVATGEPVTNRTYAIYQFFAHDPEGRTVEVQTFL